MTKQKLWADYKAALSRPTVPVDVWSILINGGTVLFCGVPVGIRSIKNLTKEEFL